MTVGSGAASSGAISERLRRISALSNEVLFTISANPAGFKLHWISPAATEVLGISADVLELVPESLLLHVHPADAPAVRAAMLAGVEMTVAYRWRLGAANGPDAWRWLEATLCPVEDHPGVMDGRIRSTDTDHRLQSHLANAETHEAATIARLEEVDTMREHIANALSHRVRTPLAILKGCSETALDPPGPLSEDQKRDLFARIGRASATLEALLTDLLDLPSENLVDFTDGADLGGLLDEAIAAALDDDHLIVLAMTPDLFITEGAAVLRRCIDHALQNVSRHTPVGTAVTIETRVNATGHIDVLIADDGPGLPDRVLSHLFDPFVTGEDGANPGLGIGFSLMRHLVEQLKGTLEVVSGPSRGVALTFTVPMAPTP